MPAGSSASKPCKGKVGERIRNGVQMHRITRKGEQTYDTGKTGLWLSQSVSKAERSRGCPLGRGSRVPSFAAALGVSFTSTETKEMLQSQEVR